MVITKDTIIEIDGVRHIPIEVEHNHNPLELATVTITLMESRFGKVSPKRGIKQVIFHDPATIVFWHDGSKTVVKAQNGELYDKEKGLAMCICKKVLGNKGNYNNEMKKWLEE